MSDTAHLKDMPHPLENTPLTDTVILPLVIQRLLQAVIIITVPIVLVLGGIRLVMTEQFLEFEYQRAGFPEDNWGFTTEDRIYYGGYGVRYLINNEDIRYLGDLTIEGESAFNERELQHMEDVQAVTRVAFQVLLLCASLLAGSVILLSRKQPTRPRMRRAIQGGGILTFGVTIFLLILVVVRWDFFFDTFHAIFFEGDTWLFSNRDTLIRLYPQQFWFDASILVGIITFGGALLCIVLPYLWEKRLSQSYPQE